MFRGIEELELDVSDTIRSYRWAGAAAKFNNFQKRAELQNSEFPTAVIDRMAIAQHFGVPTALLDWSRNIFTAIFFAVREVFADLEFADTLKVFIYHVTDERLLHSALTEQSDLALLTNSAFINPCRIDQRIVRQQGVFTFHPYPAPRIRKVPVNVYILEWPLIQKMIALMKGFGFTEDFYFPDYAGIAHAVTSETSL
jgi:hypothetical protein